MKYHTLDTMILDDWFYMLHSIALREYDIVEEEQFVWEQYYIKGYSPREALDEKLYGE